MTSELVWKETLLLNQVKRNERGILGKENTCMCRVL